MKMLYHINHLCPRTDISMGRCGFSIQLFPGFKEAVAKSKLTQQNINHAIEKMGRAWLDGCGYSDMHDPDNPSPSIFERRNGVKLGPNAYKLYPPNSIRVSWGEWGPEHITVPGNACGLDIDRGGFGCPRGGSCLQPHNVDSLSQVILLLVVFTWIADGFVLDWQSKEWEKATD